MLPHPQDQKYQPAIIIVQPWTFHSLSIEAPYSGGENSGLLEGEGGRMGVVYRDMKG